MKKKIEELFRLAMKAQEKTSAFVSFETSNHGWGWNRINLHKESQET